MAAAPRDFTGVGPSYQPQAARGAGSAAITPGSCISHWPMFCGMKYVDAVSAFEVRTTTE